MTQTIKDILSLPHDAVVYSTTGTLTKLYPRKTGNKNGKDWSIQNGLLQDETGEIKLMITGADDEVPKHFQGQQVEIKAYDGAKGWSGSYAHDDVYNGATTRVLKITKTGSILPVEGTASSPKSSVARPETEAGSTQRPANQNALAGFTEELARINNAQYLVLKAVENLSEQSKVNGVEVSPDQKQALVASAYITLERGGFVKNLDTAPIWTGKEGADWD